VFGTLETLRGCNGVAVDPARSLIYVARNFRIAEPTATAVTRIRRRPDGTHVIERDITVGPTLLQPQSIAVDAAAGLVFVGCLGGGDVHPELLVLDAGTLAVQHRVRLPRGAPWVASREGSGIAYVVTSEGLHLVDGRNGRMGITIKAGPHPQGVAVDPVSGAAYVGDRHDHSLKRVETPATVAATAWR
jgi:DNA-binding beta-propeller fold protein YncE